MDAYIDARLRLFVRLREIAMKPDWSNVRAERRPDGVYIWKAG